MNPVSTRIPLLLLFFSSLVVAVNFENCLEEFKKKPDGVVGGVNSTGFPTTPANAFGLTYDVCKTECGDGSEDFVWKDFAQLFASWLLPWLALICQLPFNSGNYSDDLISVAISVGSPALAAYSLVLTALNARSVYRRAYRTNRKDKADIAKMLISLQQIPLELTKDERLLADIPVNDKWIKEIVDRLDRKNAWSLAAGSSVAWVIFAFLLTLVDSFASLNSPDAVSEGHAVGTIWLWLLCLVIGWLWVPTFSYKELRSALDHANRKAANKVAKTIKLAYKAAKANVKRIPIPGSRRPAVDPALPALKESEEKGESILDVPKLDKQETDKKAKPDGQETDQKADSVPNPAQHQSAVSLQVPPEGQQGHRNISAHPNAHQSSASVAVSIRPETHKLLVPKKDFSSLNRDEFRLAATFNYSRVMRYLVLVEDVLRALDKHTLGKTEKVTVPEAGSAPPKEGGVFPEGVFASMFNATVLALILQCGIIAAATVIVVYTPTIGLGCRSLGYIIYGGIAVIIMFLTITSTILARVSETRKGPSTFVKDFTAFIAIAFRRISLLLALANATGLIVLSCFQFSHFLDNCYCNGSVLGQGAGSYIAINFAGWTHKMRIARISATVLAAACMAVYMIFLWLMSAEPDDIDHW